MSTSKVLQTADGAAGPQDQVDSPNNTHEAETETSQSSDGASSLARTDSPVIFQEAETDNTTLRIEDSPRESILTILYDAIDLLPATYRQYTLHMLYDLVDDSIRLLERQRIPEAQDSIQRFREEAHVYGQDSQPGDLDTLQMLGTRLDRALVRWTMADHPVLAQLAYIDRKYEEAMMTQSQDIYDAALDHFGIFISGFQRFATAYEFQIAAAGYFRWMLEDMYGRELDRGPEQMQDDVPERVNDMFCWYLMWYVREREEDVVLGKPELVLRRVRLARKSRERNDERRRGAELLPETKWEILQRHGAG